MFLELNLPERAMPKMGRVYSAKFHRSKVCPCPLGFLRFSHANAICVGAIFNSSPGLLNAKLITDLPQSPASDGEPLVVELTREALECPMMEASESEDEYDTAPADLVPANAASVTQSELRPGSSQANHTAGTAEMPIPSAVTSSVANLAPILTQATLSESSSSASHDIELHAESGESVAADASLLLNARQEALPVDPVEAELPVSSGPALVSSTSEPVQQAHTNSTAVVAAPASELGEQSQISADVPTVSSHVDDTESVQPEETQGWTKGSHDSTPEPAFSLKEESLHALYSVLAADDCQLFSSLNEPVQVGSC